MNSHRRFCTVCVETTFSRRIEGNISLRWTQVKEWHKSQKMASWIHTELRVASCDARAVLPAPSQLVVEVGVMPLLPRIAVVVAYAGE